MAKKIIIILLLLGISMILFASARDEQITSPSLYIDSERNPFVLGIFYGIFFFIIFYYIILFVPSRDYSYLLFAVWIFSMTGLMMVLEGTVFSYFLNEKYPIVSNILNYLFQGGSFVGGFLFFRVLLSTRKETPRLDKLLLTNIGLVVLYLCLYFFGVLVFDLIPNMKIFDILGVTLGVILSVSFIWLAIVYFKKKRHIVQLYIPGLLAVVSGVWIHNYSQFSPAYEIFFVKYAIHIGILIMIFCFVIALAMRFNRIKQDQEDHRQKLIQADKMVSLGTMASSLAHEMANPNSAIISNALFLDQNYKYLKPFLEKIIADDEIEEVGSLPPELLIKKIPQAISGILNSSDRIKEMIHQLRDYYTQSSLRKKELMNLNMVIDAALALTRTELKRNAIAISKNYASSLPAIRGNFQQLEQVIINLIINSKQAVIEKRQAAEPLISGNEIIMISTEFDKPAGRVVLSIKDSGAGMDRESINKAKEAFFSTKLASGGSGLGLYISNKIVSDHGGQLEIFSEKEKGTEVVITFPLSVKE